MGSNSPQNLTGSRMKTTIRILPYFLTTLFAVGFWWFWTLTDNYAWNPEGKELLILDVALTSIFYYKILFWLVVVNLIIFTIQQLIKKNYKPAIITATAITIFYFFVGQVVDEKCAFHYYSVFQNQSTSEEYIHKPILEAGYQIGPILTENIAGKEMEFRRYAISGLVKIKYKPAIPALTKILLDKSEIDFFRADAFQALTKFDTNETKNIISNFRKQAKDTLDKKVIELAEQKAER